MSEATCKSCPNIGVGNYQFPTCGVTEFDCCRRNPPPWTCAEMVDPDRDWCGEHPDCRTSERHTKAT